jgi:chromate transporter
MAAVVGVIANLAIYFAIHTLFREVSTVTWGPVDLQVPHPGSLKPLSLAVAALAALLVFRAKWSVLRTLGACAAVGLGAGVIDLLAT